MLFFFKKKKETNKRIKWKTILNISHKFYLQNILNVPFQNEGQSYIELCMTTIIIYMTRLHPYAEREFSIKSVAQN